MGDIFHFEGMTKIEIPPAELLDKAKEWDMEKCIVIGFDEANELCFGGSFSDVPLINMLLDLAKRYILDDGDDDEG